MITTPKMLGLLAVAFVAGSFVASPELRAYAAATIGSADIIDESIQSVDIKNGQVKASDIATDAVTAKQLAGVTKLLFGQCKADSIEGTDFIESGDSIFIKCSITGVDSDESAIATIGDGQSCFVVRSTDTVTNRVDVLVGNVCELQTTFGTGTPIGVIVFDK